MYTKCDDIIKCAGSGHHLRPDRIRIIKEMPGSVVSGTFYISNIINLATCDGSQNHPHANSYSKVKVHSASAHSEPKHVAKFIILII